MIDDFLDEKVPETPESVREYLSNPVMTKKEQDHRAPAWVPSSPNMDGSVSTMEDSPMK